MTIYVVIVNDRHTDPEPHLFSTRELAIENARLQAVANARMPKDIEEEAEPPGDWLFLATYSVEGDSVWVVAKEVDEA